MALPAGGAQLPAADSVTPSRSLILNEILYDPAKGRPAWVEIYNAAASRIPLGRWVLSNGDRSKVVRLPAWKMPPGAYLVVTFGRGRNDRDFGDGRGVFHPAALRAFFGRSEDAAALYRGPPDRRTIVDFVAWTSREAFGGGTAYDDSLKAGIWPESASFPTAGWEDARLQIQPLQIPVARGHSIGRDRRHTDTNRPADWDTFGGDDALRSTPGATNRHDLRRVLGLSSVPAAVAPARHAAQGGKKEWTVMLYADGRDVPSGDDDRQPLVKAWIDDINAMERGLPEQAGNLNVIAQLFVPGRAVRYEVKRDTTGNVKSEVMDVFNGGINVNPGDPAALTNFVNWAEANYPARKYAVFLGGHGQGWKGVLMAGPKSDFLTMRELEAGLGALNQKFETVGLESCLMSMTEVGFQLVAVAKTMVASEEMTWVPSFPWDRLLEKLGTHLGWGAGEFADQAAELWAGSLQAQAKTVLDVRRYTVDSIDLAKMGAVTTAADSFAKQLEADVDAIVNVREKPADNAQILVKKGAREKVEKLRDFNFIDLHHFAELVRGLDITASALAKPVLDAVDAAVRVHKQGSAHSKLRGLSIHFPHDQLFPNEKKTNAGKWGRSFDDPLFDPAQTAPTAVTHAYRRDVKSMLVPKIRPVRHPMRDDDPGFKFPTKTSWDEFLHRYYKPVADACIRMGGKCVKEATVAMGAKVQLSGVGSSDSDGREGPSNDVPAHETTAVKHYYWDFVTTTDSGGDKPAYAEGVLYAECDGEDCDRDDADETDDDRDASGKVVDFTCPNEPSEFLIRLMVWDEHHDEKRIRVEELGRRGQLLNEGQHWLHFKVDDDTVKVKCVEEDHFEGSQGRAQLILPDGRTELLLLQGPTTVHVDLHSLGDPDGDGLEQVPIEIVQLRLVATSRLVGPVEVTLDPEKRTVGEIEEKVNLQPGRLDLSPFATSGTARSYFDVFFLVSTGAMTLHNGAAKRMEADISYKPPRPGETYTNLDVVDLLTPNNAPSGFKLGTAEHTPNPYYAPPPPPPPPPHR